MPPQPQEGGLDCTPHWSPVKRKRSGDTSAVVAKAKKMVHDLREDVVNVGGDATPNIAKVLTCQNERGKARPRTPAQRVLESLKAEGGGVGCGDLLRPLLPNGSFFQKHADNVAAFLLFIHARQEHKCMEMEWKREMHNELKIAYALSTLFSLFMAIGQECFERKRLGWLPYSQNHILAGTFFTNMYRETDRGTMFLRRNVIMKRGTDRDLLFKELRINIDDYVFQTRACARMIGSIPGPADWPGFRERLQELRREGVTLFTCAHQVMGLDRLIVSLQFVLTNLDRLHRSIVTAEALNECVDTLKEIPNVADFFAWQIVCDLLELKVIYFDENSWTCLGPGAKHGLEKIFPNLAEGRMLESAKALYRLQKHEPRQLLTDLVEDGFTALGVEFTSLLGKQFSLKNVEHALCEFDKYWRSVTGGNTRSRQYQPRLPAPRACQVCSGAGGPLEYCVLCGRAEHAECAVGGAGRRGGHWLCGDCATLEGAGQAWTWPEAELKGWRLKLVRIMISKPV